MSRKHGETNKKGWTKSKLLYQYRPLHSCLINLTSKQGVRALRPLFVYATDR